MLNGKRVSVIIPAIDEEESISKVIDEIPKDIADDIIVVDNGSSDKTADRARESGAIVLKEDERGYGAACLKGISHLNGTDIVVILDADLSDYPDQMIRLAGPIAENKQDFVLGSRVLGVHEKGAIAKQAWWGNKLAISLIFLFFRFKFSDMGPFRAISSSSLKELNMSDKNFGWNVQMQIMAIKKGLRIKEVPVDYRKRIGRSKISGTLSGTILAGSKIIYTILKYALMR
ncbi:glycosyltransferase family 2 protein [Candidatus Omnitrophota bacterium]